MTKRCEMCGRAKKYMQGTARKLCKPCRKLATRIDSRITCAAYYAANRDAILARRRRAAREAAALAPTTPMDAAASVPAGM
jgi:hypothetical protein